MANFDGHNELERRLRTELQTDRGSCICVPLENGYELKIYTDISNHQARRLGEILFEGHQVVSLVLDLSRLTDTGDYQAFLDFIQNDSDLRSIRFRAPSGEVARRFFGAVSRSNSIQHLYIHIHDAHLLPTRTDNLLDLLRTTTSISHLGLIIHSWGDHRQHQWGDAHEIERAFAQNTTIKKLVVQNLHPTDFVSILRAMRRNLNIDHLVIYDSIDDTAYFKLSQELPFFKGLKRLECRPDALNAMMMEAFQQNGSLVEVTSTFDLSTRDPLLERYLERNRGIQRVMASPGIVPDNLIPLIFAAAAETSLCQDLIFEVVKAKAHLFQDLVDEEIQNNDSVPLPLEVPSNETRNNEAVHEVPSQETQNNSPVLLTGEVPSRAS